MPSPSLYTIQTSSILETLLTQEVFRADWQNLSIGEHEATAYRVMADVMRDQGLPIGVAAPVWAWLTEREQIPDLAEALLSEAELAQASYHVLELQVPAQFVLLTSYHGWCDAFFECSETGIFPSDLHWLEWQSVDAEAGDSVQAVLPYLRSDWLVGQEPLDISNWG